MAQQTAVDWIVDQMLSEGHKEMWKDMIQQAKQMEKEQIIEHLTWFQIYLNDKGLITNHDWDWEKLAKQYIKKECK